MIKTKVIPFPDEPHTPQGPREKRPGLTHSIGLGREVVVVVVVMALIHGDQDLREISDGTRDKAIPSWTRVFSKRAAPRG
ncbi:hypothetical protein ACOMHN_058181 [Nucella lapillus]